MKNKETLFENQGSWKQMIEQKDRGNNRKKKEEKNRGEREK
jgi:hypothetical protein